MAEVLIVENDRQLASLLHQTLVAERHRVRLAHSLAEAYSLIAYQRFDLALIDLVLDDGQGFELVEYLHVASFPTRTMIISQLSELGQRLKGFEHGADEYLVKPFSLDECRWRVRRLLGKYKLPQIDKIGAGDLMLYPETGQVEFGNQRARRLRRREAQILACLLHHKNSVVTREMLIDQIWTGESEPPTYSTLDVYLRRLRISLGDHGGMIKTVRGFGYLLQDG